MKLLYVMFISAILLVSCNKSKKIYVPLIKNSTLHQVKIKEVIQGGTYTYLFVNENDQDYWMAVSKTDAEVKDVVYYKNALEKNDFKSEELDRVFDKILFVQNISDSPKISDSIPLDSLHHKGENDNKLKEDIKVEPAPGGITIGELFKNRKNYANKKVLIRGQVIKVNKNIMDRNWVHLKDGTSDAGKSDLTLTTLIEVKVGDIVTFEGVVALDKEYGAGYVYPLIVEKASLK
jgi:hypothetical protein